MVEITFFKTKALLLCMCLISPSPILLEHLGALKSTRGLQWRAAGETQSRKTLKDNSGSLCVHWPTDDPASTTEP